ncbi:MAG: molybdenum cofactor biosynthesis protein MoaE [Marinagarivorans sp.]|nr:molybdenum cofactor biosynthesis protein MoaE [Marinagarivorans sp.]
MQTLAAMITIQIQTDDFDHNTLYQSLRGQADCGAIVTFTGLVREFNGESALFLEHYPGMTEHSLARIAQDASQQWPLQKVTIVHRVGELLPAQQIVFVGVASAHRHAAFAACEYIMDMLKTRAPFWKKEGATWVEAKTRDHIAAKRWMPKNV